MKIFEESIDELATIVEEGARADFRNTKRFVEPAQGTLRRAQSRRHHIIFGRRGSGKSSLLFKSAEELTEKGYPIAFIDLEPFKGHQYPDIIISVLIAALAKIKLWLQDFDENERPNRKWYEFWKKKTTDKSEKIASLNDQIQKTLNELINQLHLSDDASLINKINDYTKKAESDRLKGASSTTDTIAPLGFSIEGEVANSREDFSSKEAQEEFKRSKRDYLLRKIIDFQGIFKELYSLTERDCFLFLDDLYHILRKDQASLIDYFHRISKGNKVWLKIGTIRTRTDWYQHTPQPMGLKLGDDADEINLDLTLEKFSLSKDFLRKILRVYIEEANAPKLEEFVADTGLDRLVLSSGGVARDFLGLFRKSITEARERLSKTSSVRLRNYKIAAK